MLELLIAITIIGLGIASAYDLKWKYVPDYVSYSLMVIGAALRALFAIEESNFMILGWSLIGSASLFAFGYILYKMGTWGGGDVKIAFACGLLLSWFPTDTTPFFINFAINLMLVGAIYGIPVAVITAIKKKPKIKLEKYERFTIPLAIAGATVIIVLLQSLYAVVIGLCIVLLSSIRIFKVIEDKCFIKKILPDKLMDGDWLIDKVRVGKKLIKPRKEGLTKAEVLLLKDWYNKGYIKYVKIKDGIAYVPAFLITTIITLLFDNLLFHMMINSFYQ